ncbi:hypothetical protein [Micromonospora wenchangensis]|uniref:hypothetical protein n=1 Tax=Micromonospora wenchangensis TaxID=1185415 RepID=UPI00382B948F
MSTTVQDRPVIDRPDVVAVVVAEQATRDAAAQDALAADTVAGWQVGLWPDGLVSRSCFVSTDGRSVLTYAQWSSYAAIAASWPDMSGDRVGVAAGAPYELYRRVLGGAVRDPEPVPECFPAATFPMANAEAARNWIDGLLAQEEANEGANREYPGALAANFHVSVDGTSVFLLSEWASEAEAVAHIEEVIAPLLAQLGTPDPGARYRHFRTLARSGR